MPAIYNAARGGPRPPGFVGARSAAREPASGAALLLAEIEAHLKQAGLTVAAFENAVGYRGLVRLLREEERAVGDAVIARVRAVIAGKPVRPHPLLAEIESFIRRAGMTRCAFGELAVGRKQMVGELQRGRRPGAVTVARCREFIAARSAALL